MPDINTQIDEYMIRLQEQVKNDYLSWGNNSEYSKNNIPVMGIDIGKRWARIVRSDKDGTSRSAFGFIDMTNGNVMKSAGWKGPAKNFARGHITDTAEKMKRISWTSIS